MNEKISLDLGSVQQTLLLPVWGRAVETQKPHPLLIDPTAVELINRIDYDFSGMAKELKKISLYGWIRRSLVMDQIIQWFLERHPRATVVNIGCGLDTTFERVDNGSVQWMDLDLPDVIDLRRKFIPEGKRRRFMADSFLRAEWLDQLIPKDNLLFLAAGVFYYFEEYEIKAFLGNIADRYPGSEVVFDTASPVGIKMANKMVIRNGGMNEKSFLKWGLKKANSLQSWDDRILVLNYFSLFRHARKGLDWKTRIDTYLSDLFRMQFIMHLKIKGKPVYLKKSEREKTET
jgi:O-methyltransferase involved in polyketide biosynthesis